MSQARKLSCDVCIFGAGAAGLYLAELLSRDASCRVAVLEAGPRHFAERREPYAVRSNLRNHRGVNEARVTALGGATNTWGGGLIRPLPADLLPLAGEPGSAWPIRYAELATHMDAVERDFGTASIGLNPGMSRYDTGAEAFLQRHMKVLPFSRKNFARSIGAIISRRPGVSLSLEASMPHAIRADGGQVQAVDLVTPDGPLRVEARHFVIAAGAVNSVLLAQRFLGAGGKGTAQPLGRHIHDHFSIPLYAIKPGSNFAFSKRFSYRFERGFMLAERYEAKAQTDARESGPGAFFHFTFDFERSPMLRAIKALLRSRQQDGEISGLHTTDLIRGVGSAAKLLAARFGSACLYIPPDVEVTGVLDLEQMPSQDWRLEPTHNPLGCNISWDIHARDIDHAGRYSLAARDLMRALQAESPFQATALFPDPAHNPAEFEAFVRARAWDTYHLSGGLRMGSVPDRSLVSPNLAFHGLANLHAVSTAVFPRGGASNPTLALLALTRRLAGHLRAG